MQHNSGLMWFVASVALGCGFLAGSRLAPQPLNSELADAQIVAQNRDVRWVAYQCGDDNATYITRDMPNFLECKEVRRLSDSREFPAPPRY